MPKAETTSLVSSDSHGSGVGPQTPTTVASRQFLIRLTGLAPPAGAKGAAPAQDDWLEYYAAAS
jgi:hypothetical protein